jgi:hypothetical protein
MRKPIRSTALARTGQRNFSAACVGPTPDITVAANHPRNGLPNSCKSRYAEAPAKWRPAIKPKVIAGPMEMPGPG